MPLQNKLVVAGFSSLLGLALLVYANPRARGKAAALGILLGAGVISLPFVFTGQPLSGKGLAGSKPGEVETESPPEGIDPLAVLREKYGTKPLEAERARLREAGVGTNAYGVFLTNLLPPNKYAARDYLIRDTEASPSSYPYPRDDGNYLMVLSGVAMDIGKVAEIAGRLGKVERSEEGIGLVVVRVENTQFLAGPAEKFNNKDDPAFYELNQHELRSIDLDRVERAVARMAEAEPLVYRQEISQTLIVLLGKPGITFHDSIAKALIVWAEEPDAAAAAGLAVLRDYATMGAAAPENLLELVTRGGSDDAIPTLNQLWKQSPDRLGKHYGRFGGRVIPGLMAELAAGNKPLRRSAIRLLGEVGTEAVAVELEKLSGDEDPEVRVLAERAIAKIRDR